MNKKIIYFLILSFASGFLYAQVPAFPGAEGFGALATGGRGGDVYHVTNLEEYGEGSFREAVSQGNRTVVFDVSGVIKIKDPIKVASNITIAGQTSPGEGIVVYGNVVSFSHSQNIIVRHIKLRGSINMPKGKCTLTADSAENIIFDHVSVQWGRWDNLHIKYSKNITLQYCLIGESIDPQRFGALLERPTNLTIHHCLWIDNQSRNPKAKADIQFINNVVYNWGSNGFVGGHSALEYHQDIINNYFIAGPNSKDSSFLAMFTKTDHVYHQGNMTDLNKDGALNGYDVTDDDFINKGATLMPAQQNVPSVPVTIDAPATAYQKVLNGAGASIQRDLVDRRIINYLTSLGKDGKIFNDEDAAGAQLPIKGGKVKKDSDGDGIPDKWEKAIGLDWKDAADGKIIPDSKGYTYLEKYLNELAERK